ncbi:MAG: VacJ family lipoprotein [Campylobacterota bacterium]|nr:VacJ family lipoprotein [Campylobacterota bacterium]
MIKISLNILVLSTVLLFNGCSTKSIEYKDKKELIQKQNSIQSEEDSFLDEFEDEMQVEIKADPLAKYNKAMTSFNDGLYEYVLGPVSKGYSTVVHKEIRESVNKFFHNIFYPIRLVNNLLQGKFKNASEETGRFVINTTIGVFGLFDPARSQFNLEPHNEDFGQTLGYWGVKAGPHIVLPFLGPSNIRDALSLYPDSYLSATEYYENRGFNLTHNYGESLLLKAYEKVNYVSLNPDEYQKLKEDAVDLYPYLRDVYEQYREKLIEE